MRSICNLDGCERPVRRSGLCNAHHLRQARGADLSAPIQVFDPQRGCVIVGCDRKHSCRGYCGSHYTRARANGEFPELRKECKVQDCDGLGISRGWCNTHYIRSASGRSMDWERPPANSRSLHAKLRRLWGPAKLYPCIACSQQAAHWAYDGSDPEPGLDYGSTSAKTKGWYSPWPEFYMPMCAKCHAIMDGAKAAAELAEYREWKYKTRMTLPEMELQDA